MIAFLIPVFIVIAITVFSSGGNILKGLGDSFSGIQPYFFVTKAPDQKEQRQLPAPSALQKSAPPSQQIVPPPAPPPVVIQTPSTNSPYFGKVTISSMSTGTPSLITLRANLKQGEEISLTGWKVKGRTGEFTIGKGITRVGPDLTLVAQDNITMRSPDTVYLSSARGPFGFLKHFRPNSCMGFLSSSFVFPIAIPSSCNVEKPTEEYLFSLSLLRACEDFILQTVNYSSCAMTDYSNDVLVRSDSQCVSYLSQLAKEFTYEGCYYNKESKPDFLKPEWHIYTGMNLPSQRFDEIKLLDQNDLLVDQKKYSL